MKTSAKENIGGWARVVALALLLLFPLAASAAQVRTPAGAPAPAPAPERPAWNLLDEAERWEGWGENRVWDFFSDGSGISPERFLLKSEPHQGCGVRGAGNAVAHGDDTLCDYTKTGPVETFTGIYVSPGVDGRVARIDAAGVATYTFGDALQSVHQVTGPTGAILRQTFTDAWGNNIPLSPTPPPPTGPGDRYGFTGRENDTESGLMHYRARSYDPVIGRFTSRDPIRFQNRYIYVHDDPVNRTDPSGLYDPKGLFDEFAKKDKDGKGKERLAKLLRAGYRFIEEDDAWDDVEIDPENKTIGLDPDLYDDEGADYLLERLEEAEPGILGKGLQGAFGAIGSSVKRAEGGLEMEGEAILPEFEDLYTKAMVDAAAIGNQAEKAIVREAALFALAYVGGKAFDKVLEELSNIRFPKMSHVPARGPSIGPGWKARAINDPACRTGCEKVAAKVQALIGGDVKRITPKNNARFVGKYRGQNLEWTHHEVVVREGRVYDAFTGHEGLPIDEYKKLWEDADALEFGF
ncbi:MAG: RHS repeat-associated core domain-containing protein [Planctomycetes bacterium]|nr:RHS repeat-associated core domain-containing protein [Planctomycetota bacterium]